MRGRGVHKSNIILIYNYPICCVWYLNWFVKCCKTFVDDKKYVVSFDEFALSF